jgi:hypothetical protein
MSFTQSTSSGNSREKLLSLKNDQFSRFWSTKPVKKGEAVRKKVGGGWALHL